MGDVPSGRREALAHLFGCLDRAVELMDEAVFVLAAKVPQDDLSVLPGGASRGRVEIPGRQRPETL